MSAGVLIAAASPDGLDTTATIPSAPAFLHRSNSARYAAAGEGAPAARGTCTTAIRCITSAADAGFQYAIGAVIPPASVNTSGGCANASNVSPAVSNFAVVVSALGQGNSYCSTAYPRSRQRLANHSDVWRSPALPVRCVPKPT